MDHRDTRPRRPAGINFLLGGTLAAMAVLAFVLMGGDVALGTTAPSVRIDAF